MSAITHIRFFFVSYTDVRIHFNSFYLNEHLGCYYYYKRFSGFLSHFYNTSKNVIVGKTVEKEAD